MRNIHLSIAFVTLAGCGEVVAPGAEALDAGSPPTIASVSPDHGPVIGGVEVSITGEAFEAEGETQVVVGGVQAADVSAAGGTVTFTLPPGTQEGATVDITVFNQNGFAVLEDAFRYNERPVVLAITPERGRGVGGTNVTLTGRGFADLEAGTNTITIAGAAATNVLVVDDETLTATTGVSTAEAFSPEDVALENANGTSVLDGSYQVTQPGLILVERSGQLRVFYVSTATGNVNEIGRTTQTVKKCVTSPSGTLFAEARRPSDSEHELVTFDPLTGFVAPVGLTTLAAVDRGLATMAFVGNTLYGIAANGGTNQLVTVNTTTGALIAVGATLGAVGRSMTLAAKDASTLWLVDSLSETLDTISTAGVLTAGVAMNGPSVQAHGSIVSDGVLYVAARDGGQIYTVNTTTGALTEFARVPNIGAGALCATPPTF